MIEKVLQLIKELELLRAEAITYHNDTLRAYFSDALTELYWASKHLNEYE